MPLGAVNARDVLPVVTATVSSDGVRMTLGVAAEVICE
jgi:hypothetical protein